MPGILAAIASVLTAVTGLYVAINNSATPDPSPNSTSSIIDRQNHQGETGWIYVGTRIDGQWISIEADGSEPALTLDVTGVPKRGLAYRLVYGVNLRKL